MQHLTLPTIIIAAIAEGASDIYISPIGSLKMRTDDGINEVVLHNRPISLEHDTCEQLLLQVLTDKQVAQLQTDHELDFVYDIPEVGRFRCNYSFVRGTINGVFRSIPRQSAAHIQ